MVLRSFIHQILKRELRRYSKDCLYCGLPSPACGALRRSQGFNRTQCRKSWVDGMKLFHFNFIVLLSDLYPDSQNGIFSSSLWWD